MIQNKAHTFQILLMYLAIGLSGYITWSLLPIDNEVIRFLISDIVMTFVCFFFSTIKKNSSVYDAYWSVIPFFFVVLWAIIHGEHISYHHYAVFFVISFWSWRLTLNWARSWPGFHHEDWRYVKLAKDNGKLYPLVNFFGIHAFPTFMVFVGMWPIFYIFQNQLQYSVILYLGVAVSIIGTLFEFFADNQLAAFRSKKNKTEKLLDTGLWARSRNPNYLGEILFWVGLFIIGLAYAAPLYTIAGAVTMMSLFLFISIPMKEKRMLERRPSFKEYMDRVPMLFPKIF